MLSFLKNNKTAVIGLIFVLLLPILSTFFRVETVYAQSPVVASLETTEKVNRAMEKVEQTKDSAMKLALISSLTQGISYFTRKFAHDAAVFLASGATGQNPQVYTDGFGSYMKKVSGEAAIQSINNLTKRAGLNICEIPNVQFMANLKVNLATIYEQGAGPKPECNMADIKSNWTNCTPEQARDPSQDCGFSTDKFMKANPNLKPEQMANQFVSDFKEGFTAQGSDFGIEMTAMTRVGDLVAEQEEAKKNARLEGDGFKPVSGAVDNEIKTPAHFVKQESEIATGKEQLDLTQDQLTSILGSNSLAALTQAGDVFLSTLASRVLDRVMNEGLLPDKKDTSSQGSDSYSVDNQFSGYANSSRTAAENAFAFFEQKVPSTESSDFSYSQLSSCPEGPAKGVYNCIIDNDFNQALVRAQQGEAMTIREAIDKGFLHGDWPFIPPQREKQNMSSNCYENGYCYANIKKLRKLRIVPLGFEIAAMIGNPDRPEDVTLEKVVNNFDNCNDGGERDNSHPYCHLIDPNWVIKAPAARCEMEDFGPQLASKSASGRKEICTDITTCVRTNEDGSCAKNGYGYCTREKTVWNVPGESCKAQYATCQTYFDSDGQSSSYLSRTIDFGICSANSVGCRSYSLTQNDGTWKNSNSEIDDELKQNGRNQNIFFNQNITNNTCSAEDRGCSEFVLGSIDRTASGTERYNKSNNNNVYIKQAPDYMGCYDSNPDTNIVEEPDTIPQAKLATANNNSCQNFSKACTEAEVGCKDWTSVANPSLGSVPGKIGNNSCNTQCVGYDVYFQEETVFEQGQDKNYFIPDENNVQRCSAEQSGCSEFTNLSQSGQGGENLEYYTDLTYCENPRENNQKTFYTWEGSTSQGYRIQTHSLAQYTSSTSGSLTNDYEFIEQEINSSTIMDEFEAGSPKYNFETIDQLKSYYNRCNADTYEERLNNPGSANAAPDTCREYRDQDGNIYYRLEDKLLEVSSQCHKLRKTETNLVESDMGQTACEARGGNWDNNANSGVSGSGQCFVCRGGGTYTDNNFCVYQTVSTPSSQNSCIGPSGDRDRYKGCRPYRGNKSGNERVIVRDEFEPSDSNNLSQAREDWSGSVQVVGEALEVGGYSLRIGGAGTSGSASRDIAPDTFTSSTEINYELSFWARGSNESISINLKQENQNGNPETVNSSSFTYDRVSGQEQPASISGEWSQYNLGPINFMGDPSATTSLVIEGVSSGNNIFIDKFQLTRGENKIYAIKDSWERQVTITQNGNTSTVAADVPLVCDSNPTDNLPGEALGCELYEDSQGKQQATVGFERLCRANAVGCRPVYETYNTDTTGETWYNAVCPRSGSGAAAQTCEITASLSNSNTTTLGSCEIDRGRDRCFVDNITIERSLLNQLKQQTNLGYGNLYNNHVATSTVVVPADDYEDTPKFRTITQDSICDESSKGCRQVGQQKRTTPDSSTSSYSFDNEMYILNDPERYIGEGGSAGTLCQSNQIGCKEYSSDDQTVYFKDPKVRGNECVYKEGVPTEGRQVENASGWFKKEVGRCSNNDNLCKQDSDCGDEGSSATCQYKGQIPCYENSQTFGNKFQIWSEDSDQYQGFVGSCPASQNQCTKIIDPADKSRSNPNGKPYYRIFDQQIEDAIGQCQGQASLKAGCVLFDQTENPEKVYNSEATYEDSRAASEQNQNSTLVEPIKSGDLDSNLILKVDQDRQCAEWLSCQNEKRVRENGEIRSICTDYVLCSEENAAGVCTEPLDVSEPGYCSNDPNVVCSSDSDCGDRGSCIQIPEKVTDDVYSDRDVSWYGRDYSGFSMLNKRHISNMINVSLGNENGLRYRAYKVPDSSFVREDGTYQPEGCIEQGGNVKTNWTQCGFDNMGMCYNGSCIKPTDGDKSFPNDITPTSSPNTSTLDKIKKALSSPLCQVYPEQDSPFSQEVLLEEGDDVKRKLNTTTPGGEELYRYEFIKKKNQFSGANICQDGNCSCRYSKVTYENSDVDYYSPDKWDDIKRVYNNVGVCRAGPKEGQFCNYEKNSSCSANGENYECVKTRSIRQYEGFFGHCLERDPSTHVNGGQDLCLTWYPSDSSATNIDVHNNDPDAGFNPEKDIPQGSNAGLAYCTEATNRSLAYDYLSLRDFSLSIPNTENSDSFNNWSSDTLQSGNREFENLSEKTQGNILNHINNRYLYDLRTTNGNLQLYNKGIDFNLDGYYTPQQSNASYTNSNLRLSIVDKKDDIDNLVLDIDDPKKGQDCDKCSEISPTGDDLLGISNYINAEDFIVKIISFVDNSDLTGEMYSDFRGMFDEFGTPSLARIDYKEGPEGIKEKSEGGGGLEWREYNHVKSIFNCGSLRKTFFTRYLCNNLNGVSNTASDTISDIQKEFISLMNLYAWRFVPPDTDDNDMPSERLRKNSRLLRLELSGPDKVVDDRRDGVVTTRESGLAGDAGAEGSAASKSDINQGAKHFRSIQDEWGFLDDSQGQVQDVYSLGPAVEQNENLEPDPGLYKWYKKESKRYYKPGGGFSSNNDRNSNLYASKAEVGLNAFELRSVNFTPLRFPAGAEGQWPALGNKELMINFSELNNKLFNDKKSANKNFIKYDSNNSSTDVTKDLQLESIVDRCGDYKGGDREQVEAFNYPCYSNKQFPRKTQPGSKGQIWQYLQRGDEIADNTSNNKIEYRYVVAYNHKEDTEDIPFVVDLNNDSKIESSNDPFKPDTSCDDTNDRDGHIHNNWLAISMDFDKNGNFLGYNSRICQIARWNIAEQEEGQDGAKDFFKYVLDVKKGQFDDASQRVKESIIKLGDMKYENKDVNEKNISATKDKWGGEIYDSMNTNDKFPFFSTDSLSPTNIDGMGKSGIQFAVIGNFNDRCIDYSAVYDESSIFDGDKTTNKAWTNRVWNGGQNLPNSSGDLGRFPLNKETKNQPFGSSQFNLYDLETGSEFQKNNLIYKSAYTAGYGDTKGAHAKGVPFACVPKTKTLLSNQRDTEKRMCQTAPRNIDPELPKQIGRNYYVNNNTNTIENLQQIFAESYKRATLKGDKSRFDFSSSSQGIYDVSGRLETEKHGLDINEVTGPPQIYSINPHSCITEKDSEDCVAFDKGNVTINGDTGEIEDYDDDGAPDNVGPSGNWKGLIGNNVFRAKMRFFAYADHNHMPIRRVVVDWGDGSDISTKLDTAKQGSMKNRKPFCFGPGETNKQCSGTQLTCQDASDCPGGRACEPVPGDAQFGNSEARGCKPNYFEYWNDYTCGPKQLNDDSIATTTASKAISASVKEQLERRGVAPGQEFCLFKPKVQVLDNWGWCNGSCGDHDEGEGPSSVNIEHPNGGCYDDGVNEQCTDPYDSAWTEFKGNIIVIPEESLPENRRD